MATAVMPENSCMIIHEKNIAKQRMYTFLHIICEMYILPDISMIFPPHPGDFSENCCQTTNII